MPRHSEETKEYARTLRRMGKSHSVIARLCGVVPSTVQWWIKDEPPAVTSYTKKCRLCGAEFTAKRRDATYCTPEHSRKGRDVMGWKVYGSV